MVFGTFLLFHHFWLKKVCTVQTRGDVSFFPYESGSKTKEQLIKVGRFATKITGMKKEAAKLDTMEFYYEVITCTVNGSKCVIPTGHQSTDNFSYSMGQNVVTVAYDPSNPKRYIVLEKEGTIGLGVMCIVLGAAFVILPLIIESMST